MPFPIPQSLADAQDIVLASVGKPCDRASLIAQCVKNTEFSKEEREDRSPSAPLNRAKCKFGNAINFLLGNKRLVLSDDLISLNKQENAEEVATLATRDTQIRDLIFSAVERDKPDRATLLDTVYLQYVEKYGDIARDIIRADAGRLLKGLLDGKTIGCENGRYIIPQKKDEREKFEHMSSESFETASVMLLCRDCEKHGYAAQGTVTDGPQDGGIDGEIVYTDDFGVTEKSIVQMKYFTSKNKQIVPEVEVREFLGVLSASDANRGYFLTNAKFGAATRALAKKYNYKYFVLIDGETWLNLAKQIGFEIPEN